jgi:hypothetical protein
MRSLSMSMSQPRPLYAKIGEPATRQNEMSHSVHGVLQYTRVKDRNRSGIGSGLLLEEQPSLENSRKAFSEPGTGISNFLPQGK